MTPAARRVPLTVIQPQMIRDYVDTALYLSNNNGRRKQTSPKKG